MRIYVFLGNYGEDIGFFIVCGMMDKVVEISCEREGWF